MDTKYDNSFEQGGGGGSVEPIDQWIDIGNKAFEQLIGDNGVTELNDEMESKDLFYDFVKTFQHVLTILLPKSQSDIDTAAAAVRALSDKCNKYRRCGFISGVMKMIKTPEYHKYSDLECHAEIIHGFSSYFGAVVLFSGTNSVYELIRVVYRFKKFSKSLQESNAILKAKTEWLSEKSRTTFEGTVRVAIGITNVFLSIFPPNIMRIMNFIGYYADQTIGFKHLEYCAFELTGIGSRVARLFLMLYWIFIEPHLLELNPDNTARCAALVGEELAKYPNSELLQAFDAQLSQISGDIDSAIEKYNKLANVSIANNEPNPTVQSLLMYCNALKCDWNASIVCAQQLRQYPLFSPAFFTYAEAVFRMAKGMDESDSSETLKASQLFGQVPMQRIKHLGKTATPDKIAVISSEKYAKCNEHLILPELEILYQMNWLSFIKGNELLLKNLLKRVNNQIEKFNRELGTDDYMENYLSASFYKAVLYKLLGDREQAKDILLSIHDDESRINREYSIRAQTCLELGLIELEGNCEDEAKEWLNRCVNDYKGYLNENYVHLRAFAALRKLGLITANPKANKLKEKQYKKQWLEEIAVKKHEYKSIIQTETTNELTK